MGGLFENHTSLGLRKLQGFGIAESVQVNRQILGVQALRWSPSIIDQAALFRVQGLGLGSKGLITTAREL